MKLLSLSLTNFRKHEALEFKPNGGNARVYLQNRGGKTTLADALAFLFFNSDSKGRGAEAADIKTHVDGVVIPMVDHTVEGSFLLEDGSTITLKKTLREKWETVRGIKPDKPTGHENLYWINTVPVGTEREFNQRIESICPRDVLRQLTSLDYFISQMKWEDRRRKLLEICGDVSDAEVIEASSALSDLPKILEGRSTDEHKKILVERKKKLKAEREGIPGRIDEVRRGMPAETPVPSLSVTVLQKEIQELNEKRARANAGGAIADKQVAVREIDAEIAEAMQRLKDDASRDRDTVQKQLFDRRDNLNQARSLVASTKATIEKAEKAIAEVEAEISAGREAFRKLKESTFYWTEPVAGTCGTCGQTLPLGDTESMRVQAEQNFNAKRAADMEANIAEGRAKKAKVETWLEQLATTKANLATHEANVASIEEEVASLTEKLNGTQVREVQPTAFINELQGKKATLLQEIEALRSGQASAVAEIDEALVSKSTQLSSVQKDLINIENRKKALARIDELGAEEKRLGTLLEQAAREESLIEEFVRAKVRMLTDRINSRFELCSWRLFEEQLNGGLKEVCEATLNGTPYSGCSTSERINMGLDCLNTLADFHGFSAPIFIDNCESISHPIATRGQQIRLIVSPEDTTFRYELDGAVEPQGALL